jgi:flagellar motility protein MotE (MotC chaperone)
MVSAIQILGIILSPLLLLVGIHLRNEISALRKLEGVRSEVSDNRQTATDIARDLSQDIEYRLNSDEKYTRSPPKFSVSAYNNLRDSGDLSRFSEDIRKKLKNHYKEMNYINREIEDRKKEKITETSDLNEITPHKDDAGTILDIVANCSDDHIVEIYNQLESENIQKAIEILDKFQDTPIIERNEEEPDNFNQVLKNIREELESHWLPGFFYRRE